MAIAREEIEAERVRFEKWFNPEDSVILKKDGAGNYTYMVAFSAFKTWLAAKQDAEDNQCSKSAITEKCYWCQKDPQDSIEMEGFIFCDSKCENRYYDDRELRRKLNKSPLCVERRLKNES